MAAAPSRCGTGGPGRGGRGTRIKPHTPEPVGLGAPLASEHWTRSPCGACKRDGVRVARILVVVGAARFDRDPRRSSPAAMRPGLPGWPGAGRDPTPPRPPPTHTHTSRPFQPARLFQWQTFMSAIAGLALVPPLTGGLAGPGPTPAGLFSRLDYSSGRHSCPPSLTSAVVISSPAA